jgi:hypothetical protein
MPTESTSPRSVTDPPGGSPTASKTSSSTNQTTVPSGPSSLHKSLHHAGNQKKVTEVPRIKRNQQNTVRLQQRLSHPQKNETLERGVGRGDERSVSNELLQRHMHDEQQRTELRTELKQSLTQGEQKEAAEVAVEEVETCKQLNKELQRSGQDEQEGKELTQSVVQGEQKEAAEVAVEEEVETCTQSVVHDEQNNSTSCCCYATLQQSLELQGSVHDEQQRNTLQQSLAQDEQKEATNEEQESSHSFAQSIFANAPFKMVTSPITNYNRIDMAACAVCIAVPLDNAMVLQLRNDRGQILVSGFEVYAE